MFLTRKKPKQKPVVRYLFQDVIDVIINLSLSVDSVRIHASIDIIFQEEMLERHQIFLLERDNHLVAQPEGH